MNDHCRWGEGNAARAAIRIRHDDCYKFFLFDSGRMKDNDQMRRTVGDGVHLSCGRLCGFHKCPAPDGHWISASELCVRGGLQKR